ncbi:MAG: ABC transporter permease [Spirochaetales bacterium]|nr:ABC transporter permease [Spirochaetales bacterium]
MVFKIAKRNVRRQIGSYALYFLTIAFTVSMLFAVENMLYSDKLSAITSEYNDISTMVNFSVVLVSIVSAVVLGYTSAFMVRLRSREFGLYLTLGMQRKEVMRLFIVETAIISLLALIVGFLFGIVVFQILMNILMRIMDISFTFSFISIKATLTSLITAVIIFTLSSFFSLRYINKETISSLLSPRKSEKTVRHIRVWVFVLILSGILMVLSFFVTYRAMKMSLMGDGSGLSILMLLVLCFILCFIFHFTLSKTLFSLLCSSKMIMRKGMGSVIVRDLQSKATSNSLLIGTLSILFLLSIIASNISVTEKVINEMDIDKSVPYSVMAYSNIENDAFFSKVRDLTEKELGIVDTYEYYLYSNGKGDFGRNIKGWEEMEIKDTFMKESDFNHLLEGFGRERVNLGDNGYIVASRYREMIDGVLFPDVEIEGREYSCISSSYIYPDFHDKYMVFVLPDSAINTMKEERKALVIDALSSSLEPMSFYLSLRNERGEGDRVWSRDEAKYEANSSSGVLIIAMLFVSSVSTSLALAILSVKALSSINEDKTRMNILRSLGIDREGRTRVIGIETLVFFLLPLVVPLLSSLPVASISKMVYSSWEMEGMEDAAYLTALGIGGLIVLLSIVYFFVTLRLKTSLLIKRERERLE